MVKTGVAHSWIRVGILRRNDSINDNLSIRKIINRIELLALSGKLHRLIAYYFTMTKSSRLFCAQDSSSCP